MVFVYSPAMLLVLGEYFTWPAFLETAVSGYFIAPMPTTMRLLMALAAVFMVAPGADSDIYAMVLATPVLLQQFWAWRQRRMAVPEVA